MYIIITGSPNKNGLTAACAEAVYSGITGAGAKAEIIDLFTPKVTPCLTCDNGWGVCRSTGKCVIDDCFAEIQAKMKNARGIFIITPVYFEQPSEYMKSFLDRLRRCESFRAGGSWVKDKQISFVAAAGGSGNGTPACLLELERWCRHVRATAQERLPITRYNREPMLKVIEDAGRRMVSGEYFPGW